MARAEPGGSWRDHAHGKNESKTHPSGSMVSPALTRLLPKLPTGRATPDEPLCPKCLHCAICEMRTKQNALKTKLVEAGCELRRKKGFASKSDRGRQISYDIAYMWNLKKKKKSDTNELIYKTKADSQT